MSFARTLRRAGMMVVVTSSVLATLGHAQDTAGSRLKDPPATPTLPRPGSTDAGRVHSRASLSAEDKQVVDNLELLENMDQANDLDLLVELSKEN